MTNFIHITKLLLSTALVVTMFFATPVYSLSSLLPSFAATCQDLSPSVLFQSETTEGGEGESEGEGEGEKKKEEEEEPDC